MTETLGGVEVRVLGSLIEKEITTPEYYPMSLNALVNACNQSSNRDPVMRLSETEVRNAVNELRQRGLVRSEQGIGARVQKFRQRATETWNLAPAETAVLDVLMLRGPQTAGEIRSRAQRMHDFASIAEAETVLDALAARREPLVVKLAREPGRKEARYAHMLAGTPTSAAPTDLAAVPPHGDALAPEPRAAVESPEARLAVLESAVQELRREFDEMRSALESFRRQFE